MKSCVESQITGNLYKDSESCMPVYFVTDLSIALVHVYLKVFHMLSSKFFNGFALHMMSI